ncbi:MAG: DUF3078 domain-containing protein [Phocaeicola sp.]|nr:DUF3078 domain-containing protein [Phocaeicola sp.]MBR1719635.1 DUF3078 domain-containing protein [Phocaeicola sp.]
MRKSLILFAAAILSFGQAHAQNNSTSQLPGNALKSYSEQLNNLSASYRAYYRLWNDASVPAPRIKSNPDYYKLFVPPTYYSGAVGQALNIDWQPGNIYTTNAVADSLYGTAKDIASLPLLSNIETKKQADRWANSILLNYYMEHMNDVRGNELYLADVKPMNEDNEVKAPRKEQVTDYVGPAETVKNVDADELLVVKPNFWKYKGNGFAQFSQNYISDNWYKGGESTVSLLSGLTLEANYDDQQRVQWDNKFEAKLGFITAPSDTVHDYKTNTDLIRLSSKLGVKARKYWYYTIGAEFKTQFFANYKTNTNDMISNFLSPFQFDLNLGMDYKRSGKNYTLSVLTSPLAYTFIYISNDKIINPGAFNVKAGHHSASLFGSKVTGVLNWKITPTITWDSRIEYFTTYKQVIANWENTFNFAVTKYLSTKLFVNPRFDDGVKLAEGEHSYLQLQELFSFGLNYTW